MSGVVKHFSTIFLEIIKTDQRELTVDMSVNNITHVRFNRKLNNKFNIHCLLNN